MSNVLRIALIIFALFMFILAFVSTRRGKVPVKYSLIWFIVSFVVLLLGILPVGLEFIANLIDIKTISNLIVGVILTLLLIITLVLTMIVSNQKKLIRLLIQEVSMMKLENKCDVKNEKK